MSTNDMLWQFVTILPARLSDVFDLSTDKWFAIAAIATLWAYMILAPGRDAAEL